MSSTTNPPNLSAPGPSNSGSARGEHEIAHGKFLVEHGAELTWGWGTPAGKVRAQRRAAIITRNAGLSPGKLVLEIGCGTGLFTEAFAQSGATIVAVDISDDLLRLAQQRGLPADRVRFVCKSFEDCALDGPFDAIVGSSVLHHLEVERSLSKCLSLLKPGGTFSFAEPNMLNPQIFLQKNVGWIKKLVGDSPDETAFVAWRLVKLLTRIGFTEARAEAFDWLHPSTPRPLIPLVSAIGRGLEATPLLRRFAGSLAIFARRPA